MELDKTNKEEVEVVATEKPKTEKQKVEKVEFLNPYDVGVTYVQFQEALGKKSVAEYCKGKLTEEQIEFLEKELELLNKK